MLVMEEVNVEEEQTDQTDTFTNHNLNHNLNPNPNPLSLTQLKLMLQLSNEHEEQTDSTELAMRGLRDVQPAHYLFKINNFSSLLSANIYNYESTDFEVSGYKWRLRLYPEGKKNLNKNKHISLYLVLSESNSLPFNREVNVYFKLFVYNQILDKYLTVQDATGRISRFGGMKTEFGFNQLLPLDVFKNASNGYLIDDCCIFGCEVFVVEPIRNGESVSVVNNLDFSNNTYTWNVPNFAELQQEEYCKSPVFVIGGYKWSLWLYPNGDPFEEGKSLSMYLNLEEGLNAGGQLSVDFVLRVKDQLRGKHHRELGDGMRSLFSESTSLSLGYSNLIPLSILNDASEGYLVNGAIILEVKISFITKIEEFS